MVDEDGYRMNVGIIIANREGQLLWARRCHNHSAWQFPQGGIKDDETPEEAMYRELTEELGLQSRQVELVAKTEGWLSYRLPIGYWRLEKMPLVIGQKQKWFLLRLLVDDAEVNLGYSRKPEFDKWIWVDYMIPVDQIIAFKRDVYVDVLKEFEPIVKQLCTENRDG